MKHGEEVDDRYSGPEAKIPEDPKSFGYTGPELFSYLFKSPP
jgi:hypothetical protein